MSPVSNTHLSMNQHVRETGDLLELCQKVVCHQMAQLWLKRTWKRRGAQTLAQPQVLYRYLCSLAQRMPICLVE